MSSPMFQGVSVCLDEAAPEGGAFAHAGEWASRLGLPLRTMTFASRQVGPLGLEVRQYLRPGELCVFGNAPPTSFRGPLVQESLRNRQAAVLVCPADHRPVSRVLVLNQPLLGHGPRPCPKGGDFLQSVAAVCRAFQVEPVLLTVAGSEAEAKAREQYAEEALGAFGLAPDFDVVMGCDLATAVVRAACWRRCTHVLFEMQAPAPPWRRFWGDPTRRLLGASHSLTFLAVPPPEVTAWVCDRPGCKMG